LERECTGSFGNVGTARNHKRHTFEVDGNILLAAASRNYEEFGTKIKGVKRVCENLCT